MAIAWPKEKCQSSTKKATPFPYSTKNLPKKDRWNLKVLSSEKKLLLFHIWHSEKGDIFLFWEPPNWVNCGPEKKTLLRICILLFSILRPRCVRRRGGRGGDFNFRRATLLFPQNKRANIHYCGTSFSKGRTGLTFRIQLVRAASNSKQGGNKKRAELAFQIKNWIWLMGRFVARTNFVTKKETMSDLKIINKVLVVWSVDTFLRKRIGKPKWVHRKLFFSLANDDRWCLSQLSKWLLHDKNGTQKRRTNTPFSQCQQRFSLWHHFKEERIDVYWKFLTMLQHTVSHITFPIWYSPSWSRNLK